MIRFDLPTLKLILCLSAFICFLVSVLALNAKRTTYSLVFLLLGSICLFLLASFLDPFLNLWDERFHALVAKNLVNHPLMPALYDDPVVAMAYDRWDRAVIWLHKQPLFLWQIAFSFRLLGENEVALRLPSVIMGTCLVFFAYRIGYRTVSQRTGFIAGVLTATSFHLIELVSGRAEVDHNDVSFLFYVTASIWAWVEYISTGKRYWILFIGLFSGFAILCKWLVGLLVYCGWGLYNILAYKTRIFRYPALATAFLITLLTVLPWQILIFSWYPAEAIEALRYNMLHFNHVLEGHGGSIWYYFEHFGDLFGMAVLYLALPSLVIFLLRVKYRPLGFALVILPLITYLFFSVAATKMPSYPFVVAVPVFLFVASAVDAGLKYIEGVSIPPFLTGLLVVILFAAIIHSNLQPARIVELHRLDSSAGNYSRIQIQNKLIFQELVSILPEETVVFNVKGRHYIECMFYTGFPSYSFIPAEDQVVELIAAGRHIAIFPVSDKTLPRYLTTSKAVTLIPEYLEGWE